MQEKILITGGAGFIGSNFARYTAQKYTDEIIVLDKLTYAGNLENIQDLIENGRARFIQGDIADRSFIDSLFAKEHFTKVINFAAETHVDRSILEPALFVSTNIVGTHNLLQASLQYGAIRYHQVSTDEVYGDLGDFSTNYFTETTPLAPNCPYAASKAAADMLVCSYWETYQLPVTISRCSNNYGPYQFPEKLIPFFFQLAEQNKPLPLYGDGNNIRDWLYVEDHCEGIDAILRSSKPGEVYNIGGHNERKNREIANLILDFLGKPSTLITYVQDRKAHDRRYAIDPTKLEKTLAWKPKTSFTEGIKKTFEWYRTHRPWWQHIVDRHKIDETGRHLRPINKQKPILIAKQRATSV